MGSGHRVAVLRYRLIDMHNTLLSAAKVARVSPSLLRVADLLLFHVVSLMSFSSAAPTADQVTSHTVWKSRAMPELGLSDNTGLGHRVYVLDCADSCLYVGIEVKARLASRLKQHFVGGGAFFTNQHRPRALHLVWPAACTAVECYVYHALLAGQPAGRVERLGGWTHTSTKVSPLAALVFEQARRSLRGSCFNCGGTHYANMRPKAMQGCTYPCPSCSTSVVVSSRGQSLAAPSVSSPSRGASPQTPQARRAPAPSAKRAASPASSGQPVGKAARVAITKAGCVVSVLATSTPAVLVLGEGEAHRARVC